MSVREREGVSERLSEKEKEVTPSSSHFAFQGAWLHACDVAMRGLSCDVWVVRGVFVMCGQCGGLCDVWAVKGAFV